MSYIIPITGLVVTLLSVLALFSHKTPIGGFIFNKNFLLDRQIDTFFTIYKQGLIYLLILSTLIVIYFFISFINFIGSHFVLLYVLFWSIAVVSFSLPLLRNKKSHFLIKPFAEILKWAFLLTLIMFGVGYICSRIIDSDTLLQYFYYTKSRAASFDNFLAQSNDIEEYTSLYERIYRVNTREMRFIIQYEASNEDYDLWGPVNWSSAAATYVVGDDTLDNLRLQGITEDDISKIATLLNKNYTGKQAFTRAIDLTEASPTVYNNEAILKYSIRSKQKSRENEFKEVWQDFANSADRAVVLSTKSIIEARFNSVWHKIYFFPPEIQPNYVASLVLEVNLHNFSALVVTSKIAILNLFFSIMEERRIYIVTIVTAFSFLACYFASIQIKKYIIRYDPDFSDANSLFFAIATFIGLIITITTFNI